MKRLTKIFDLDYNFSVSGTKRLFRFFAFVAVESSHQLFSDVIQLFRQVERESKVKLLGLVLAELGRHHHRHGRHCLQAGIL